MPSLKKQTLQSEKILNKVPALIAVYDLKTAQYLFVNDSIRQLLGYTPAEFLKGGLAFATSLVHPSDIPRISKENGEALRKANRKQSSFRDTEPIVTFEYRMMHKDGLYRWLHTDGVVYEREKKGSVEKVMNISIDITTRKEKELKTLVQRQKIEAIQSQLAAIVTSSHDAIVGKDLNSVITSWNKSAERIFGYTEKEAIGKSIYMLIPKQLQHEEKEIIARIRAGKHIDHYETVRVTKEGHLIPLSLSISPIKNDQGKIVGAAKIARDISERKKLESEKDDFVGIATHELKTPVTSIKAYAQVLQSIFVKNGDEKSARYLSKMNTQLTKLTNLIADLLDVNKIQKGFLPFTITTFQSNALIDEIVEELQHTTDNHTIVKKLAKTKQITGDRDRIGQVLTNIISNAIKYSPRGGKIIVSSKLSKKGLVVSVQDFGTGIPKEKQDKIFEKFFRVHSPEQDTLSGLGLGLYISSEIIRRQKGKMWVDSKLGKGSTFYFSLPVS